MTCIYGRYIIYIYVAWYSHSYIQMSHANLVTQLPHNKEEMVIECTEIVDSESEADVCGSVFSFG